MKIRNLAAVAAAATLVSAPVVAAERSAAPVEGESELAGGVGVVIGVLAAAAIITAVVIAADGLHAYVGTNQGIHVVRLGF